MTAKRFFLKGKIFVADIKLWKVGNISNFSYIANITM